MKDNYPILLIEFFVMTCVIVKFCLPKVNTVPIRFKNMSIDYNNCDNLSQDNKINMKHANLWLYFQNCQVQYICIKVMIIARKLDIQYQFCNKTIHKIFLEDNP